MVKKTIRIIVTFLCTPHITLSSELPKNSRLFSLSELKENIDLCIIDGRNISTPRNPLIELVDKGDIQEIKRRVLKGARVNEKVMLSPGVIDYTLLWHLITNREKFNITEVVELIDLLIQKKVNLDQPVGQLNSTILHYVAKRRVMSVVNVILAAKPTINAQDGELLTPLHLAAWEDEEHPRNLCLIGKLIAAGADVNALSMYGQTPLYYAVTGNNNKEATQLLLNHGALPGIKDNAGKTACDHAVDDEIKILLLEQV